MPAKTSKTKSPLDHRSKTFCDLLKSLWQTQNSRWKGTLPAGVSDILIAAQSHFGPLDYQSLEKFLPKDTQLLANSYAGNRFLYLPPLDKNSAFIPILSFRYSFKGKEEVKLGLHLVTVHDEKLHAFGYRFETGHPAGKTGSVASHDFQHAQLCVTYDGPGDAPLPYINCPSWIPTTQPSFPLPANDYVGLLICLLVSLYGGHWINVVTPSEIHNFWAHANSWKST